MTKKANLLIIALFFLFFISPLHPQEHYDVITSIEVIGLSRTRPHVAIQPLERFLGLERTAFDQNDVFAVIIDMGILDPVSAELIENEDGLILLVTVEEKWSIFPLPLVIASSGEFNAGIFLLDTNAFGMRDMVVLGGMYGSFGWSAMAMYNQTPRSEVLPGWNVFFIYGRQEREAANRNEEIYSRYAVDQLRFSLGFNYLFFDLVTGSLSFSYSDLRLRETDEVLAPPEDGASLLGISPGISMRQSSWDGFFLSQQVISLEYSYNYAISGNSFHQVEFRGIYEQPLFPGFRLNIRSGGVWKSTLEPLFEEGPQKAQVSILPRNYSARHYAGLSLGAEKHLYRARWGTISAQSAWQGVFSHGPVLDSQFDHGPSIGIHFYLSRLALPAMGANIGYNINSGLFQFTFTMGMSF